jgi:hypothetical protein
VQGGLGDCAGLCLWLGRKGGRGGGGGGNTGPKNQQKPTHLESHLLAPDLLDRCTHHLLGALAAGQVGEGGQVGGGGTKHQQKPTHLESHLLAPDLLDCRTHHLLGALAAGQVRNQFWVVAFHQVYPSGAAAGEHGQRGRGAWGGGGWREGGDMLLGLFVEQASDQCWVVICTIGGSMQGNRSWAWAGEEARL